MGHIAMLTQRLWASFGIELVLPDVGMARDSWWITAPVKRLSIPRRRFCAHSYLCFDRQLQNLCLCTRHSVNKRILSYFFEKRTIVLQLAVNGRAEHHTHAVPTGRHWSGLETLLGPLSARSKTFSRRLCHVCWRL